jgi:hypothetical protein
MSSDMAKDARHHPGAVRCGIYDFSACATAPAISPADDGTQIRVTAVLRSLRFVTAVARREAVPDQRRAEAQDRKRKDTENDKKKSC